MRSAQVEAARAGSMEDPQEKEGATERLQLKRATLEAKRDWATAYAAVAAATTEAAEEEEEEDDDSAAARYRQVP